MPAPDKQASREQDDLDLIRNAAREAGALAMRYFGQGPEVWLKRGDSPVSEADIAVDRFLRETLGAARPDYGWLSEETADSPERHSMRRTFVVDPIDGTRAFLDSRPTWCVSIAVVEDGVSLSGVLECPALTEHYHAAQGGGASMNGEKIAVREPGAVPVIGGPGKMIDRLPDDLRHAAERYPYIPSLAYRVALVARGGLDATFVKARSHDWDLAAADLILREAGGTILNASGKPPFYAGRDPSHGALVAGTGALVERMLPVLAASPR